MRTLRQIGSTIGAFVAVWATLVLVSCGHAPPPVDTSTPAANVATSTAERAAARYDLARDEREGGHTLARHVGRTDDQLRARLREEPGISAASTYTDRETAERIVALALETQRNRVEQWSGRSGTRPNLTLNVRSPGEPIGRSLSRRGRAVERCFDAIVVLRWRGDHYVVLTSYPEARR